jgi:uncharacterized protein (DUF1501 family)
LDLYQQYNTIRTDAAIAQSQLLPINVTSQPCSVFGVNPSMPFLQQMYNSSEALFVSNIGTLVEPLTVQEYMTNAKRIPRGLFAHNVQQKLTRNLDAKDMSAKGILGRISDALAQQGRLAESYSVSGTFSTALEGALGISEPQQILDQNRGVTAFDQDNLTSIYDYVLNLTVDVSTSILADTWNDGLKTGAERSVTLKRIIDAADMQGNFSQFRSGFANQLGYVSRIISSRAQLKSTAHMFNVELGGFDTHQSFLAYGANMGLVDNVLREFVKEMKRQGVWDKVTVVVASDFARTLGSNGQGTDHAWGGNTFVMGGSVKGGQILGQYPSSLAEGGGLNVGNGRILPTTSWEALWNSIALWLKVDPSRLNTVLPNRQNFIAGNKLFAKETVFN